MTLPMLPMAQTTTQSLAGGPQRPGMVAPLPCPPQPASAALRVRAIRRYKNKRRQDRRRAGERHGPRWGPSPWPAWSETASRSRREPWRHRDGQVAGPADRCLVQPCYSGPPTQAASGASGAGGRRLAELLRRRGRSEGWRPPVLADDCAWCLTAPSSWRSSASSLYQVG